MPLQNDVLPTAVPAVMAEMDFLIDVELLFEKGEGGGEDNKMLLDNNSLRSLLA